MIGDKIKKFISDNSKLFEDAAEENKRNTTKNYPKDMIFTRLNYSKILNELCDYVSSYKKYKDEGSERYKGRVLDTTLQHYKKYTVDKVTYRENFVLTEFYQKNIEFLQLTKQLKELLEENADTDSEEFKQVLLLTENEYNRIASIYRDDTSLWLWLIRHDNSFVRNKPDCPKRLVKDFNDGNKPCMHRKKYKNEYDRYRI